MPEEGCLSSHAFQTVVIKCVCRKGFGKALSKRKRVSGPALYYKWSFSSSMLEVHGNSIRSRGSIPRKRVLIKYDKA